MPPQTQDVSGDEDFKNLSLSDKYAYLNDTDQDFKGLSSSDQQAYLAHVAGSEPTPQPKMQTSSLPGIVRGAMSTLPAMGALAGGALSSPGLLTTPAGGAAGMGAGRAAELGINRSIFGSGEESPISSAGLKDIGLNAGMGAAMDLPAGILAKVEGVGRYVPLARKMAGEYIGKKSQTLGDIVAGGEGPKPFGRTTAPVIDQAGIPRIGNQAPEVQMVPPRMRTLPKIPAPTPFGGVEAPTPQAGIPKIAGGTPAATVSGPQSLRFMGPGETPAPPEAPRIVQPGSAPPDVKVTYQSVPGEELARKAQKGDLDAVRELRRRGGQDLPANTKYLIEPGAVNKPWRNLER